MDGDREAGWRERKMCEKEGFVKFCVLRAWVLIIEGCGCTKLKRRTVFYIS